MFCCRLLVSIATSTSRMPICFIELSNRMTLVCRSACPGCRSGDRLTTSRRRCQASRHDGRKAVSTLKVRDLLTITLTRWTSFISLTKTPPEEARRSAAPAPSAEPNKANAAPRTITLKARSLSPALLETRPPLIPFPSPRYAAVPAMYAFGVLTTLLRAPRRRAYNLSMINRYLRISFSWRGSRPTEDISVVSCRPKCGTTIIIRHAPRLQGATFTGRRYTRENFAMLPASTTFCAVRG